MVRRISLGITIRPSSSILLTIPVAFIFHSPSSLLLADVRSSPHGCDCAVRFRILLQTEAVFVSFAGLLNTLLLFVCAGCFIHANASARTGKIWAYVHTFGIWEIKVLCPGYETARITTHQKGLYQAHCADAAHIYSFHHYSCSARAIQRAAEASLGMRQSPRGERVTLPTLGPSGRQLRLNCCVKKRR